MSRAFFIAFLLSAVIFMSELDLVHAKDECFLNADCYSDFGHLRTVCCKRIHGNVCRRNCVGERCKETSDCAGPGEYCDWSYVCARLVSPTKVPIHYWPGENTKGNQIVGKNTANKKPTSSASSEGFPGWGIGFIVIGLIIVAIVCYLIYDRCFKTHENRITLTESQRPSESGSLLVRYTRTERPSEASGTTPNSEGMYVTPSYHPSSKPVYTVPSN